MNCVFLNGSKGERCSVCGYELQRNYATIPRRNCRKVGQQSLLGDRAESALIYMGITKENYASAKEAFGLLPNCNCGARKQQLNEIHTYAKEHGWLKAIAHARTIGKTNDS
jgi:hypothetical protein